MKVVELYYTLIFEHQKEKQEMDWRSLQGLLTLGFCHMHFIHSFILVNWPQDAEYYFIIHLYPEECITKEVKYSELFAFTIYTAMKK